MLGTGSNRLQLTVENTWRVTRPCSRPSFPHRGHPPLSRNFSAHACKHQVKALQNSTQSCGAGGHLTVCSKFTRDGIQLPRDAPNPHTPLRPREGGHRPGSHAPRRTPERGGREEATAQALQARACSAPETREALGRNRGGLPRPRCPRRVSFPHPESLASLSGSAGGGRW